MMTLESKIKRDGSRPKGTKQEARARKSGDKLKGKMWGKGERERERERESERAGRALKGCCHDNKSSRISGFERLKTNESH